MATITNSICTNDAPLVLQTKGGALNIGASQYNGKSITIGNTTGSSSVSLNSGTGLVNFVGYISTAPASSHTATTSFGTSLTFGTAVQNTLGYDILLAINLTSTSSSSLQIECGVGPTSSPTLNNVSALNAKPQNFSVIVPNNYYILLNYTGTIVSPVNTCIATPL